MMQAETGPIKFYLPVCNSPINFEVSELSKEELISSIFELDSYQLHYDLSQLALL